MKRSYLMKPATPIALLLMIILLLCPILSAMATEAVPAEASKATAPAEEVGAETPAETVFTFRDGITWDTPYEEIKVKEGIAPENCVDQNSFQMMVSEGASISNYTADLGYVFRDGQLVLTGYDFYNRNAETYAETFAYLLGALKQKYGEPTVTDTERAWRFQTAITGERFSEDKMSDFSGWELSDGTLICIFHYDDNLFGVFYVNEKRLYEEKPVYNTDGL